MPWQTPSLEQVRSENRDVITARLHSGAMVPNSALRVLADANAGLAYLVLLYIDWLSKQLLPDTAETEWLDRQANIWVGGRKAATHASGSADFTGTMGFLVAAGTLLTAKNLTYQVTENIIIGATATRGGVMSIDSGAASNLDSGTTLTLAVPVSDIDSSAVVVVMTGGTDAETDDELRARVLLRIRTPPMGGDADDYVQWALQVPGVTRAWSYPQEMGIGTMTLRFMCDDLRADNNGFPNGDDVAAVAAYLDGVRPVTVKDFFVEAPIPFSLTFTLNNIVPDSDSVRAEIEQHVKAMLKERAIPGGTIYTSWVSEAISQASVDHFDLVFDDTVMPGNGYLAVLDSIYYG